MRAERVLFAVAYAGALMLTGCEQPPPTRTTFLQDNPWAVKAPAEQGGTRPASSTPAPAPSKPVEYKPDTEVVSPIFNAKGKWTVRLAFYKPNPQKKLSALYYANDLARRLRADGHDAYVTDLISLAIVSVGTFNDERDPELIRLWKQAYEDWLKIHGGHKSSFRQRMEEFYGDKTVFGDQPWPVSIIDLQIKMKGAYKIPLTEEDKALYREYTKGRVRQGENP